MNIEQKRIKLVWGLPEALSGLVLAVAGVVLYNNLGLGASSSISLMFLSYLVVWAPMSGAIIVAYLRGQRSLRRDFGWAFKPIDLLWGVGAACVLQTLYVLCEIALMGQQLPNGYLSSKSLLSMTTLILAVVIPVVIAPLIEELFFRGLVLKSFTSQAKRWGSSSRFADFMGIFTSSVIFAGVHILGIPPGGFFWLFFCTTLLLGIMAAILVTLTGRLGGAIVLHVTNNAFVVFLGIIWM